MKILFLPHISDIVGLVAGEGAWKDNKEYKYKLVVKTFLELPGTNKENGAISSVHLVIRRESDNVLVGKIIQAGFVDADQQGSSEEQDSNTNDKKTAFDDVELNKPFKIHLTNGVIQSLSADPTMTVHQINQLKFITSQFQVDTKAQNVLQSDDNRLPDASNSSYYMTMEQTVTGECETTYDITKLPNYLAYANRDKIPLFDLIGDGEVIQIVKNTNYTNCKERARYLSDAAVVSEGTVPVSLSSRIMITGSMDDYTIQSSVTTNKIGGLSEYIYLTLKSVKQRDADSNSLQFENLENIGSLVYKYEPRKAVTTGETVNGVYQSQGGGLRSK